MLRPDRIDWPRIEAALDDDGYAVIPGLLGARDCAGLRRLYADDARFRTTVDMARHRYGRGEYRYFERPLPALVERLRAALYPPLAAIANRWNARLGATERFPESLAGLQARCATAGQLRPTPLLLRYDVGDFNHLHQDRYGEVAFPLQVAVLLDRSERDAAGGRAADFEGGEFLLVEQRPRQQSRASVVPLGRGDAVIFPNDVRPVAGARRDVRARVRHGVSVVRSGRRTTLGLIFHDAR